MTTEASPGPGVDVGSFLVRSATVRFARDGDGHLEMHREGAVHKVGAAFMAFPLSWRRRMIVLRDPEGDELGVLDGLKNLDEASRGVLLQEIEKSYFLPVIRDVLDISEEHRVVTWRVTTNRGPRTFQVRNIRHNLRKIGRWRVILVDVDGNRYDVPNWTDLPPRAQRLVEKYV